MHSCWVAEKYERGAQGESPSTTSIATDGGRHHDTLMRCEPARTDAEIVRGSTAAGHGTWGARGLALDAEVVILLRLALPGSARRSARRAAASVLQQRAWLNCALDHAVLPRIAQPGRIRRRGRPRLGPYPPRAPRERPRPPSHAREHGHRDRAERVARHEDMHRHGRLEEPLRRDVRRFRSRRTCVSQKSRSSLLACEKYSTLLQAARALLLLLFLLLCAPACGPTAPHPYLFAPIVPRPTPRLHGCRLCQGP